MEAQSHQLAFKMITVGVVWELSTSSITSHVVGVLWEFFFSFLMQSLPVVIR